MTIDYTILDFRNNLINLTNSQQQEMFLHEYLIDFIPLDIAVAAVFLDREIQFSVRKQETTDQIDQATHNNYESIEMDEPNIFDYSFANFGTYDISVYNFALSDEEQEVINYSGSIQFQFDISEDNNSAQSNYINSIKKNEIQFDILSSLGAITSEDAITDSTTTGTTTTLTTTTETITDVGGATATGERTFTAFDTSGNDDTSTATIRGGY